MRKIGEKMNQKAQLTIFVIIAIVIVAAIVAMFILIGKQKITAISPVENPKAYIEDCIKTNTEAILLKIIPVGGLLNPENSFFFSETKVTMICSTIFNNKLCTNNHPMLNSEIENEIALSIKPAVEKCFAKVANSLVGYDYTAETQTDLKAEITPKMLSVKATKKIAYNKGGQAITLEDFNVRFNSGLWDFVSITGEIVNQEIRCNCPSESCNADFVKISLENPRYEVGHFVAGSGEEVYSITELDTGQKFNIALRNCVKEPL